MAEPNTFPARTAAPGGVPTEPHLPSPPTPPGAADTDDLPPDRTPPLPRGDATLDLAPPVAAGATIAGRYKLLEPIGEGGMGTVWAADQTEPVQRRVAVKLVRADRGVSKTILARFEAERQAIAVMDHPHIAKLLDAGATPTGEPFFVMELVNGVPLTDYCDAHTLTVPDRLEVFRQVCGAVQHAHQKGVIHRDLKPGNVLVEGHDGKPVPKVIDFGLAKAVGRAPLTDQTLASVTGAVLGTPLYMAPEQAGGAPDVDTRADVYALGVILYELLTGTTPIARATVRGTPVHELLRAIREDDPPAPSSRLSTLDALPAVAANRATEPGRLGRAVRGDLDWVVMKALDKDRGRRYESAAAFAADVDRFLRHEPVAAGPPSRWYRAGKFVRRNRAAVTAAGLVLLALVGGVAGTTAGLVEARRQRDAADTARRAESDRAAGERLAREAADRAAADEKQAREKAERAEADARAANARAEKRLAEVTKGTELLGSVFLDLDPDAERKEGRPLRLILADRLEAAARRVDPEAIADPATVAGLRHMLGSSLSGLGRPAEAVAVLERAVAGRAAELGDDHRFTVASRANLAAAYLRAGRLREALPLLERAVASMEADRGPDDPTTLSVRNNLAVARQQAGRVGDAVKLFERVLAGREAVLGADDPATLDARNNLAGAYQAAGRIREAVRLYEQNLKDLEAARGADHPRTVVARGNLGSGYREAGRPADAVRELEPAVTGLEAKLGADHPAALTAANNLALAYEDAGRRAESLALFVRVLKAREGTLGPDHPDTLESVSGLAGAYFYADRPAEAVPLLERVLAAREKVLGPDHPDTLAARNNVARVYQDVGRVAEAVKLFERALAGFEAGAGPDHPSTQTARGNLAGAYRAAGRVAEAVPLLERAARTLEATLGADHPTTVLFRGNLLGAYVEAGRAADAVPLVGRLVEAARKRLGPTSPGFAGLLASVSSDLLAAGQFAAAEPYLRECLAIREKAQPDGWGTSNARSMLGGALLGQGKAAAAGPLLVAGYEGLKAREGSIPPPGRDNLPKALDRLVELSESAGKPAEAARWRAERAKYPFVAPPPRRVGK